jgi:PAT family beta-lactamase induction signal transducer AmpG
MDAYAVELMTTKEQGPGNALRTVFYRVGMLLAAGVATASADQFPWAVVFTALGFLMLPSIALSLTAPEPEMIDRPVLSMREAVIGPFLDYVKKKDALAIALFILLYKFGDNMAQALLAPFFRQELGVSLTEIGFAQKTVGLGAIVAGTLLGGEMIPRIGLGRSLWIFGGAQAVVNAAYSLTAWTHGSRPVMYGAIALEQLSAGMATAALLTLITRVTNKRFAATQFALLSSLLGLGRSLAGLPAAELIKSVDYPTFFLLSVAAAAPGLLLLLKFGGSEALEPSE